LSRLASFKVKLVLFFAILALAPLAVAFYGFDTLARESQDGRADARLQADLRNAAGGYAKRLTAAAATAQRLASTPALGRALRSGDRQTIARLVRAQADVAVLGPHLRLGKLPSPAGHAIVRIVDRGRVLGRVVVSVPLDQAALAATTAGLPGDDRLLAIRRGALRPGVSGRILVDGVAYRALATAPLGGAPAYELAVATPQAQIDSAVRSSEGRIAVALLATLGLIGAATYLFGRTIVGSLRRLASAADAIAHGNLSERVAVGGRDEFAQLGDSFNRMAAQLEQRLRELAAERSRVREAVARFGDALAATHDPEHLLQIVVESAVEATGALAGAVRTADGVVVSIGDPQSGAERLAFPLQAGETVFGTLELTGDGFGADQVETAASLASQAVVALENARLHRVVEAQARVDGLTGLANRRSIDETLHAEIARTARFGDGVCLVLCDLDSFKSVNDRFGHPCGDRVLREFADTLAVTVREADTAGRWGGEEFALVLPATDLAGGVQLAERARAAIAERDIYTDEGDPLPVTASFGVAVCPPAGSLEELVASADEALYQAKRTGKNRVVAATEVAAR
jgi:diguanylate cyclase (GGDEF)-like protein